jgi:spermidine/putrescine-binding protein
LVFTWAGYEVPELHPAYHAAHGDPEFAFYANEQEMATKVRAGFPADVLHPCADTWGRVADAGLLKPIDVSRLSNWNDLFPTLRDHPSIRDGDGNVMLMPADWGNASVIYRTDFYEGEESWCMLFDERYEGRLATYDSESAVLVAGLCHGFGTDSFNMTDEMLEEVRPLLEKQAGLVRFYWSSRTDLENAIASGEVVAAYGWNSSMKELQRQGVPVAYAVPKEGILAYICGCCITQVGEGDEDLVYEYLDAWLDPQAGKFLIEEYGYGHSNMLSFEAASPEKVAALGFPANPIEMLEQSLMWQPYDPQVLENMFVMLDEVKIGL